MSTNFPTFNVCGDPPWANSIEAAKIFNVPFGPTPSAKEHADLLERVKAIEKRLAILHPNEELQEKFPALQEAYEAYKIIEKIVNDSQG